MFKFDVAFSFLDRDEPTARELAHVLEPTSSFVYSERQLEIGGTDGVDSFTAVFRRESRIVVVLYRDGWSQTKWTRIESEAIKSRFLDDGAELLLLVSLDGSKPPDWFPAFRIWVNYQRFGPSGAASVIAERISSAGAAVRAETPQENAARLARERAAEAVRLQFLHSNEGAAAADASAGRVFDRLGTLAGQIGAAFNREGAHYVLLYNGGFSVAASWHRPFANTTQDAVLAVVEWQGRPHIGAHRFHNFTLRELRGMQLACDIDTDGTIFWRPQKPETRTFSESGVVDLCAHLLLALVRSGAERR
jgi:hypothetical protein